MPENEDTNKWKESDSRMHDRISSVEQSFAQCANNVYSSMNEFRTDLRKHGDILKAHVETVEKLDVITLNAILTDYKDKQGWYKMSNKWGKNVVAISILGGALSAIWFFVKHGSWPQ